MGLPVLQLDHVYVSIEEAGRCPKHRWRMKSQQKFFCDIHFHPAISLFLGGNISVCGSKVNRLTRDEQEQLATAQSGEFSLYIVVTDPLEHDFKKQLI